MLTMLAHTAFNTPPIIVKRITRTQGQNYKVKETEGEKETEFVNTHTHNLQCPQYILF